MPGGEVLSAVTIPTNNITALWHVDWPDDDKHPRHCTTVGVTWKVSSGDPTTKFKDGEADARSVVFFNMAADESDESKQFSVVGASGTTTSVFVKTTYWTVPLGQ